MNAIKNAFFLLKIVWKNKKQILFFEFIYVLTSKLKHMIYYILLFGKIFDLLQTKSPVFNIFMWLGFAIAFSLFSEIYQDWYINIYKPQAMLLLNYKTSILLYKKAASVDLKCYESKDFFDNYTKSIGEANNRIGQLITVFSSILSGIIMISIYLYLILIRDIYAIALTIIPLISVFVFGKALNKAGYKLYQENIQPNRTKDYVKRTVYLKEYTKEYRISNIFNALNNYFTYSISQIIDNVKLYGKRIALLQIISNFFSNTFMLLSAVLYGSYLMMVPQTLKIGDFYILVSSIFNLLRVLLEFSRNIVQIQGMSPYIENFKSFIDYENEVENISSPIPTDKEIRNIKLNNVSFHYPDFNDFGLKNINMEIKSNEKIAIVGYNGSGKTTLIKLLLRLYDPSAGTIEYNGKNIKQLDIDAYRYIYGVCFQDSKPFAMNIYENVLMDDTVVDDELIVSAIKASGIHDKIMVSGGIRKEITKEFDSDGLVLSGGEQQMLALARVFAKECQVIVLDEPTSALDPIAEENLFQNMLKACENKAVIFISHRLSSAKIADKIYFLKDGMIVEEGNHSELMSKNGYYAEMFRGQASGYQEG